MLPQRFQSKGGKRQRAVARLGLWRLQFECSGVADLGVVGDSQLARLQIEVFAEKAENLSLPHAGGKAQDDRGAEWLAASGHEELSGLIGVEDDLCAVPHRGRAYQFHDVTV